MQILVCQIGDAGPGRCGNEGKDDETVGTQERWERRGLLEKPEERRDAGNEGNAGGF